MGSTRRHFTAEYKANAVALVLDDGRSIAEAARNIGVLEMTLGKWVKKARDAAGDGVGKPLSENERAELERLRTENSELRLDNEFLGKAAAFFAAKSTPGRSVSR